MKAHPHKISRFTKGWFKGVNTKYPQWNNIIPLRSKKLYHSRWYTIEYYEWWDNPYDVWTTDSYNNAVRIGYFKTLKEAKQACKKHLLK